jgi:hypothetical protein
MEIYPMVSCAPEIASAGTYSGTLPAPLGVTGIGDVLPHASAADRAWDWAVGAQTTKATRPHNLLDGF